MKYIGLLSSAASGKLGGVVASHNRGGTYFRHHAIPTQPRTPAVRAVRNQLAAFSSAFKALTAAQISGWNALGSTVTLKSKLGTTYNPTGQQLFVSCNKHLAEINITTTLTTAPTIPSIPAISTFAITQGGTAAAPATVTAINYTLSPALPSNYGVVVRASSTQSAGRTFIGKSKYRTLAGYNPATGAPASLLTIFTNKFGPLPQNGVISFALRLVDPASGFAGPLVTATYAFYQPVGTNLYTITAANATLSIGTGTIPVVATITDNGDFTGAVSWQVLNLPPGATYTAVPNPDAAAPTITISKGTLTIANEGTYACVVQASYGTFVATANFTLTVAA